MHVAVAWYQAGRGNRYGCARQLEKATRRLAPYAPAHRGLDVADVLAQVAAAADRVEGGSLDLDPVVLDPVEPDRLEHAVQRHVQPPVPLEEEQ